MLTVDFAYYWFHRMAHGESLLIVAMGVALTPPTAPPPPEVNLFWAAHQVHHSSEDYAFPTALRQSALQRFTSWVSAKVEATLYLPSCGIIHSYTHTHTHTVFLSTLGAVPPSLGLLCA